MQIIKCYIDGYLKCEMNFSMDDKLLNDQGIDCIVGEMFLQNYYSIYDMERWKIGLA